MRKKYRDTGVLKDHGVLMTLNSPDGVTPWVLSLCSSHLQSTTQTPPTQQPRHTLCVTSTHWEVSLNCKAVPAFAQTLTRTHSFLEPTEQHLLYNWVSFRLFMTRFTWNMCFMAKLIGWHTYRQERSEGRRNSLSRSLLLLTAADSFATSDRIIEWGVIWESPHLPSCSLHPTDTHRRRRTHTGSRLEDWCCLVVAQQHLLVKETHRLEFPQLGSFCFTIPHKHKYSALLLTCNVHPHVHTHQRVHRGSSSSLTVSVPPWPGFCGGQLRSQSPAGVMRGNPPCWIDSQTETNREKLPQPACLAASCHVERKGEDFEQFGANIHVYLRCGLAVLGLSSKPKLKHHWMQAEEIGVKHS